MDNKYKVRWEKDYGEYLECSFDGGHSWQAVSAGNPNDSSEAINEAAARYGVPTNCLLVIYDDYESPC